jgi:hypothetical protein
MAAVRSRGRIRRIGPLGVPYGGIAKNVVAAGLADRALVQLAYAIGAADPVSVMVRTGAGRIPEEKITELVRAISADAPGIGGNRTAARSTG